MPLSTAPVVKTPALASIVRSSSRVLSASGRLSIDELT